MPTNFFIYLNCSSKSFKLFILFFLTPLIFYGQTLTGLWIGTISNDSTTVRKDQSFEIALTEYKGKVYGYSRSEFIVDDVLFYVVKRVKGTIEGDVCEVEDDEIIAFNFPTKLDKGVKVSSTFRKNHNNNLWQLEGTWKTNATKKFYAVTGKVGLEEEKDLTASKIFPHLEELKLANDIAFYKEREEGIPVVKIAKPEKNKTTHIVIENEPTHNTGTMASVKKPIVINTGAENEMVAIIKKPDETQYKTKVNNIPDLTSTPTPKAPENKIALSTPPKEAEAVGEKKAETAAVKKETPIQKTETPVITQAKPTNPITTTKTSQPAVENKRTDMPAIPETTVVKTENSQKAGDVSKKENNTLAAVKTEEKKQEIKTVTLIAPRPIEEITYSAKVIAGRKSEFTQEVNYQSDSLVLSLYDNGEIDGDTVSVFMNGTVLMHRQGLKASAIKKTIYIVPDSEDFTLVLFAENLGKYPPNTGLLVVRDGEEIYNLRFSSDFQKNAGIIFRRKKQ